MAKRFHASFINERNETFVIEVYDSDFVGTSTEIRVQGGFKIDQNGDSKTPLTPMLGGKAVVDMVVTPTTQTAIDSLQDDFLLAAEGRFTMKILRNSDLFWCGYVLQDLSGYQDKGNVYVFTLSATDGLARLKGIDYKDAGDVPYGTITFLEHVLNCLNQDGLSALYFNPTTDIFLRTIVNWVDNNMGGAPVTAKCPLAYSQVSGEIWAKRNDINDAAGWDFKSCYEVLESICRHWKARLMFSNGCYRLEQIDERANDTFRERRFSADGTMINSAIAATYDQYQNLNGNPRFPRRLAGGVYNYLPALKTVKIKYDHKTSKNFIGGLLYKWFKGSTNSGNFTVSDISYKTDSYIRVSATLTLDVSLTGSYTKPWRYLFGVEIGTGSFKIKSESKQVVTSGGVQVPTLTQEPPTWEPTGPYYEVSTPWIYTTNWKGAIKIAFWTPIVESGEDSLLVDFGNALGAEDGNGSGVSVTLNDWRFTDLVLQIVGEDNPANQEEARYYIAENTDVGNSEVYSFDSIFGHPVEPWTACRILTSDDGSTWFNTDDTWHKGTEATNREFGELLCSTILYAQNKPIPTFSVTFVGVAVFAHTRFILDLDNTGWLLMSGMYDAYIGSWQGEFFQAGFDSVSHIPATLTTHIQPTNNVGPNVITNPPTPNVLGGGNDLNTGLVVQATNYVSTSVAPGTVTSIPLSFAATGNFYLTGDDILIVDPGTGEIFPFEVASNVNAGDTSISVTSTSTTNTIPVGAVVIYPITNKTTTVGGGGTLTGLPAGTDKQTLRYNGTTPTANSALMNDGTYISVGGTPSTSYMLRVKQNASTKGLFVERDSSSVGVHILHDGSASVKSIGGLNLLLGSESGSLILLNPGGGGGQSSQVLVSPANNYTANLGNSAIVNVTGTYAPSSSGGDFSIFRLGTTVNQGGSADQPTDGLRIVPTLTAVAVSFYGIHYVPSTETFLYQPSGTSGKNHLIGNLGIGTGTTAPGAKLDIVGNGATSGTSSIIVKDSSSNEHFRVRNDGVVVSRATAMASNAPTISFGTGAGTGPTADLVTGGSNGCILYFTTGTTPTNNAKVFTVTTANFYPNGIVGGLTAANDATRAVHGDFFISASSNNSIDVKYNGAGALAASTQYVFHITLFGY